MSRWILVLLMAVLVAGCNQTDKDATPKQPEKTAVKPVDSAKSAAAALVYTEGTVKGRTVVVGTPKAIEALAKGSAPVVAVTKVGYGTKGETVIFEADGKDPNVEKALMAEFDKRHKK